MAKHYNTKFLNTIISPLRKNGFSCEPLPRSKNKYCISREGGKEIKVHAGMSCYHPLRRFLKEFYDFDMERH